MTTLRDRAATELRAIVDQYAAGEAEVARSFLSRPHTTEENVDVLLRQMGRELQTAHWLHRAVAMLDELDTTVDRHSFAEFLEQIAEETEHYVILADLADWASGRKLTSEELHRYQVYARVELNLPPDKFFNPLLPDGNKMVEIARLVVDTLGYERGTELVRMSEGGGGGAFIECARAGGDPFQDRLAAAMRRILKDEIKHGPDRVDGFAEHWVRSEQELEESTRWLRTFMAQHLRVRNEIWAYPLSDERMVAIDRGETAPFDPAIDLT